MFQARFGFHDSVVAVPSQAAALRAWGTHQNLFADGQATIATDAEAVKAALADPGTPLLRPVGTCGSFQRAPVALPKVPGATPAAGSPGRLRAKTTPPEKPPPDRTELDAAEAALGALEDKHRAEEAQFHRRQDELDEERTAARLAYGEAHKAATAALAAARAVYRKAGGR